jgi:predicted Rossmann fold nucleotide-binding protein DprA/Smf involved in DNA uptake
MAKPIADVQQIDLRGHPLKAIGDLNNLTQNLTGIVCSQKCPGDLILRGFDLARQLRDRGITVISGFHSPMEKDILSILLRGDQPVVLCLAKSLDNFRVPTAFRDYFTNSRITFIAADYSINQKRITQITSIERNKMIFHISSKVLIIHAYPCGNLENLLQTNPEFISRSYTLESANNQNLLEIGVKVFQ